MGAFFTAIMAVPPELGINPWGMLACAVTYAGAVFAGVDGLGDHLLRRSEGMSGQALHAMRLKTGSKLAASLIAVVTAAVVLLIDGNWIAFALLSVAFLGIMSWVFTAYRARTRA